MTVRTNDAVSEGRPIVRDGMVGDVFALGVEGLAANVARKLDVGW